ncbi:MAG: FecR domain-containing protein [Leptospiraceae bacterium]|nr:FecR domain-containing protein [Leptospiraceae bacterium]MBK9498228.1 FecR domain-containing protein [Leptospiraceae bacterium]MBP9163126.1 FecR domain-containing protein [Leptospiraceae bacterium]
MKKEKGYMLRKDLINQVPTQLAGTIIVCCLLAFLAGCKKEEPKVVEVKPEFKPQGLVLFVLGEVKMGDKQLKVGDAVHEKESIKTGKKAACDIQITGLDSDVTIRLRENSDFALLGYLKKEVKNLQLKMLTGKILVNTQKLNTKESVETITPTSVVGVRGTKFEVEIGKDSSSSISVYEGKVAAKVVIPEIEALPEDVKEKSSTLQKLDAYLIEKEVVIESGYTSTVTKKYADKVLKDTGIGEVLKKADKTKLTEELDKAIVPESFTEKTQKLKDPEVQAPVVKVSAKTFDEKLKEYDEIIAVEKTKLKDQKLKEEEIKKRMKSPELMKRIEQIMDKSAETLLLKSGERIQGVIFVEGDKYIVLTPEGRKEFDKEQVQDVEL